MFSYTVRKIGSLIPMALIITFLIYLGLELTPGDAVSHLIPPDAMANISEEQMYELREAHGLNDPFVMRYFKWLGGMMKGDFGYSVTSGVPISEIVARNLSATLELSIAALLISTILGSALGLLSAIKRGTIADNVLTVAGMIGVSIPQFFFGLVCILLFVIKWKIFPARLLPHQTGLLDRMKILILPASVLGMSLTAGVMRYARSSMISALNEDYIKTARSKGLPEWRINLVHGFRVALTPVIVLVGFRLPILIGGSVVIEEIFQRQGIGSTFVTAVRGQNYPLVMTIALLSVVAVLLSSFVVDLVTAALDPRIQLD